MTFTQPYGVTIGSSSASGSLNAAAITDMQNLGVTWLRYQVRWSLIDATGTTNQNAATYSWGAYDSAVSQCNAAGINILLSIMFAPSQFQGPSGNPLNPSYTATFASQIATRYNGGAHGTVNAIEVGNEDYNSGADTTSIPVPLVQQLALTMKAVYPAIKAVSSAITVGVACKLQRNSAGYTAFFDTLLNPSTGPYISSVFQGDYINFHYYGCLPTSGGVPVSMDPTVDLPSWNGGNGLPSIKHAWQLIDAKRTQYSQTVPIWLTEAGYQINANPGRAPACNNSEALAWQYDNAVLDSLRTSNVVSKWFRFTLGYYAGYTAPNYRDGMSLVQGTLASPHYTAAYNGLKTYSATYPTWGSGTGPTFTASPNSLAFSATTGGANPANQTVTLSNTAGSSASYTVVDSAAWMSVSPTSGSVAAGGTANSTISVNIAGLTAGTYTGSVTWTSGGQSDTTSVVLTVSDVTPPPPPGVTPFTAYFANAASLVTPTANQVYTIPGTPVDVNTASTLGTALNWGELIAQGTTNPWAASTTIGGPSGFGFLYGARALEGTDLQPGTYTCAVRLNMIGAGAVSITADIHVRLWRWNLATGYNTQIVDCVLAGQTILTTKVNFAPTGTSSISTSFGAGDKLYIEIKVKVLTNTGPATAQIQLNDLSTDTVTFMGSSTASVATPGYSATVVTSSGPYLRVVNGKIVDSAGKTLLLRGFNTAGLEFGDGVAGFTQTRINAFASTFSMNLWRLCVNVSWWNNNVLLPDGVTHYRDWIQTVIGWMKTAGCYVEIDPTTWMTLPPANSGPSCSTNGLNPPQSIIEKDTFTRANQSGWGTASNGDTWVNLGNSATFSIASNEGVVTGGAGGDAYIKLGSATASDQTGLVRFALTQTTQAVGGLLLRFTDANNFYQLFADAGSGILSITKRVAGTYTSNIGTVSKSYTSGTYYWMRAYAVGSTLYVKTWQDGTAEPNTWDIQITDSSLASGGVGLYAKTNTGDTVKFDTFSTGTPVTACITHQNTLNFPPWTQAQMVSATETFFTDFITNYYPNDPAILFDALNEPTDTPNFFSDSKAANNAIINAIQGLQPHALIFVSDSNYLNYVRNGDPDPYLQPNLVWDFHLYDDPTWTWQQKFSDFQIVFTYVQAHNHGITIGEWNANTTNDPNGFGAAVANVALTYGAANTYYNADNTLQTDNATLTAEGLIVRTTFRTIGGGVPSPTTAIGLTISNTPVNMISGSLQGKSKVGRRGELSCSIYDAAGANHYQQYQQMALFDQLANLVYSGYLTSPVETKPGFSPLLLTSFTATDQHYLSDKRIVANLYRNKTCGFIVQDIVTNILAAEGVTVGQIDAGLTIPIANFGYCTVATALDALVAAASGNGVPFYWVIDQNQVLWFVPYTAITGPTVDGTTIDDGRRSGVTPSVTRANPKYRNTQYAVGGFQENGPWDETRQGDGQTRAFTFSYPLNAAPTTFTLNSVAKSIAIKGTVGAQYYWAPNDPVIAQDPTQTILVSTDRLHMIYSGQSPAVFNNQHVDQVAYMASIDGTSGIVEAVITDNTINSFAQGQSVVGQGLTRYCTQGLLFTWATLQTGYAPGQLITVSYAPFGFSGTQMLVDEVAFSDQQDGFNLWYTVTAVMGPYDTNWTDFFGNIISPGLGIAQSINIGVAIAVPLYPSSTLYPSDTLYPS